MRKQFNKLFVLFLMVVCAFSLIFAGCGQSNVKNPTGETSAPTAKAQDQTKVDAADPLAKYRPVEGKEYKFTIAPYTIAPVDTDAKLVKYWEEKTGVKFEIWNIEWGKYKEIMGLKFASGEIPDVLCIGRDTLKQWAEQGVLAEIQEEVLENFAPNAYKLALEAEPNVLKLGRVNGKLYGLCAVPFGGLRYSPAVFRGDWLEKLGVTKIPETLEEYEQVFYLMANGDPDGNNKKDTYGLSRSGLSMIFGAYGLSGDIDNIWIKRGDKVVYSGVQPEIKEVLQLLNKWYKDGVLDPEFITGENTGGYWALSHSFIRGRIGFTAHGGYLHWKPSLYEGDGVGQNRDELAKLNPEAADKLVFAKPPKGPNGQMGNFVGGQSQRVMGNPLVAFGIQLEKEPDRYAKLFSVLDYIRCSSLENNLTSKYGIQGEDWEFDSNGLIKYLGEAANDANYFSKIGGHVAFRFMEPEQFPGLRNPSIEWALNSNFDVGILKHEVLENVDAMTKYRAECDKLQEEAFISIITGDKPLSYFDEFVEKWRKAGGDQIEKELNDWYNEFWK